MSQRINEQIGTLSAIESERHFFAVGLQMLRANFMPRPNNAALQERESRLDCVGVDVTLHVDSQAVPNRLVPSVFPKMLCGAPKPRNAPCGGQFVATAVLRMRTLGQEYGPAACIVPRDRTTADNVA